MFRRSSILVERRFRVSRPRSLSRIRASLLTQPASDAAARFKPGKAVMGNATLTPFLTYLVTFRPPAHGNAAVRLASPVPVPVSVPVPVPVPAMRDSEGDDANLVLTYGRQAGQGRARWGGWFLGR